MYGELKEKALSGKTDIHWDSRQKLIEDWIVAYAAAQPRRSSGVEVPVRYKKMIDLFDSMALDSELSSAWNNRKAKGILGEDFAVFNADGSLNEEDTRLLEDPWFTDSQSGFISQGADGLIYYPFGLLELEADGPNGEIKLPTLVERRCVDPRRRLVLQRPYDLNGYSIDDPVYRNNYILVGGRGFGLMLKASVNVIYKRWALQYWAEHAEVFSMDMIIGTTDTEDQKKVLDLQERLMNGGRKRVIIKNAMENVASERQAATDSYRIYKELADYCDAQNRKLIQGAEGLSDIGTNYKEAGNHQQTALEIAESDMQSIADLVNKELLPRLPFISRRYASLGQPGKYFAYQVNRKAPLNDRRELYKMLMEKYDISPEIIMEEFGVEVTEKVMPAGAPAAALEGDGNPFQTAPGLE
jgi:hypothetical protein